MSKAGNLGRKLLLVFSVAAAGYGMISGARAGIYEVTTDDYAIAGQCEEKIMAGETCKQEELEALVSVKQNETREGMALALTVFGGLGIVVAKKKKLVMQPA